MVVGRRWTRWGVRAVVLAVVVATVAAGSGCARSVREGSVAGVLDTKGRVFLVDLATGHVTRTVPLRSWAFDIVADPGTDSFITAQSGGVGDDADDAVGIVPAARTGRARYVTLPRPNPGGVELLGPGQVLVDHGWQEREGMFVCTVDTVTRKVLRTGHVPDLNLSARVVNGIAWVSCVDGGGDTYLRQFDPQKMRSSRVRAAGDHAVVDTGGKGSLYGWLSTEEGGVHLARFDTKTGAVEASAAVALDAGPGRMVYARGRLVAADFSDEDPANSGTRLLVCDPETLTVEREIRVQGGPCDVAVWRDRVVVCEYRNRRLLIIDPLSGETERAVELPDMAALPFMVAVLD